MTKHRLMLSAAATALLASPWLVVDAHAQTSITSNTGSALSTSSSGDISISSTGSISIKSATPIITINSNNSFSNLGHLSNTDTDSAIGILIDTSAGNIVAPTTITSAGSLDLSGKGASKAGIVFSGGNTYFGSIDLLTITTETTTTTGLPSTSTGGSSVSIQGDTSTAVATVEGTTVDGDIVLAGPISMVPSDKSTAAGANLIDLEGNLNGNLIFNTGSSLINVGSGARGVVVLGPIGACDATAMASVSLTCSATDVGTLVNEGGIQVTGTQTPDSKGGNVESGSAVVLGNSIFGGFVNEGPQTANGNIATAAIVANGATINNVATPTFTIDPGQTITATNGVVRGPAILGPVQLSVDPADGVNGQTSGFSFINHGTISAAPLDTDIGSMAMLIQGSSPTNYTCFGAPAASVAAGSCVTTATTGGVTTTVGGLLNTGTIAAQAVTAENTTSSVSAIAVEIGSYATIPRIVVSGELTSGSTATPGTISAEVVGPGGGSAAAIVIANLATVPEVDVLQRATVEAAIATTTVSPTSDFATAKSPFSQATEAIVDESGTLTTVNNAGTIAALNTVQTPGAGAVVGNTSHAIDLLANTLGGVVINNSGTIEGDIFFGAAGNGDTLNVGNIGNGATANSATGLTDTPYAYASVSQRIDSTNSGAAPTTEASTISFGSGNNQTLHVGGFGFVDSVILAQQGALNVTVDPNGQLFVANTATTGSLYANNFNINGGILGLNITQGTSSSTPVVQANTASISSTARIGLQFGGFISSGTTAASVNNPTPQVITLISASSLSIAPATLNADNATLSTVIPFLFESPASSNEPTSIAPQPLSTGTSGTNQTLLLTLIPRSPGMTNADGTAGLGLSGDALNLFPYTAKALANDPLLGAAIASNLTVTNGVGTPVLNVAASQQKSQQIFSQFTPDVSGGTRQVAIMLTDQATGPVAARQRLLRSYGNQTGELTLWGEEYAGNINNKGRVDGENTLTAYKDNGWGFAMGMDAGSAKGGWYGGALTYYSGDVDESLPRASTTHEQWYMLTGYTDWRGKHVFLDTTANLAYASLDGNRIMVIGDQSRDALGKRAALALSAGVNTGAMFNYGLLQITPHVSLDGPSMREEGYSEANGGDGLDLAVAPYYANSLRLFAGPDFKLNTSVFGISLSPEMRFGYRYDFIDAPVKLKAGFVSTGGLSVPGNVLTFIGPDPDSGTAVVGGSLTAGTDTWSFGLNYDWLRGNNGSTTQVGTLTLLGRI